VPSAPGEARVARAGMSQAAPRKGRFGDLGLRILSAAVLAAVVMIDLWLGGVWVAALAALASVLMLWELHRMVTGEGRALAPLVVVMAVAASLAVFVTGAVGPGWGALVLGAGAAAVAGIAGRRERWWFVFGLVYIGVAMSYVPVIRDDGTLGLIVIVWLILVVAAADIGAYFAGRTVGGPKLWPRVSPKKTWSGAIGGLVLGVVLGLLVAGAVGWRLSLMAAVSAGVVVASQAGDLLESAVKRHFGVKDASNLIPGHGGVMDRLDGIIGGLWFFAIYDLLGRGFWE
jgi:phosphatidate cytidylyltransferase